MSLPPWVQSETVSVREPLSTGPGGGPLLLSSTVLAVKGVIVGRPVEGAQDPERLTTLRGLRNVRTVNIPCAWSSLFRRREGSTPWSLFRG